MINLNHFNNANFTGVLHIGANSGQEAEYYKAQGIKERCWVEPFSKVEDLEGYTIHVAVGEQRKFVWEASNGGESSSCLKPKQHIYKYPEIIFERKRLENTTFLTLEQVYQLLSENTPNLLILDIQGMELEALISCPNLHKYAHYIVTEYYTEELYEGCGMLNEIVELLKPHYNLVALEPEENKGWGNAYFELK